MTATIEFRDIASTRQDDVLALNNANAAELSWLEPDELRHLVAEAFSAKAIGGCDAFMIGFDQDADYHSPNFQWFRERYPRFVYVDRVAVAASARGRGLARALYEDFFAKAAVAGHTMIACEVNSDPPNPGSDAFHAALGFSIVGEAAIYGGKRTVRYYVRRL